MADSAAPPFRPHPLAQEKGLLEDHIIVGNLQSTDPDALQYFKNYVQRNATIPALRGDPDHVTQRLGIVSVDIVSKTNRVRCIVNAANKDLRNGGGICRDIFTAAGPDQLRKACEVVGWLPTGECMITPAYNITTATGGAVRDIIHAVGPNHDECDSDDTYYKQITPTYMNVMQLADANGIREILCPFISSSLFLGDRGTEDDKKRRLYMNICLALTSVIDYIARTQNSPTGQLVVYMDAYEPRNGTRMYLLVLLATKTILGAMRPA